MNIDLKGGFTSPFHFVSFGGDIISLKFAGSDKIGEYMQQGEAP